MADLAAAQRKAQNALLLMPSNSPNTTILELKGNNELLMRGSSTQFPQCNMASHPTIKAGPIQSSPMPLVPDDPVSASHHNLSSPPERLVTRSTPSSTVHSRETSAVRGRALDHSALAPATFQPQSKRRGHSHSKSPETASVRPNPGNDAPLERRPSNSYGHHRQTSIVHGIQHSRNPSFAASTTSTSPLSPELIASLSRSGGAEQDIAGIGRLDFSDMHSTHQSPSANGSASHNAQGMLSTIEDRDTDDVPDGASPVSVAHRRMNSAGKPWRERSHSRSHSRHLQGESKTVGEYALHHLFNSFVSQADSKINQAIMKLSESDTPVEDVCGPGADPKFDQLISALGHIARQKPKPLIDTIMFWRKAKGDAVLASKQAASQPKPTAENGMLPRRNTEPTHVPTDSSPHSGHSPTSLLSRHDDIVLTERRATVSVYLVCRVLIEIFNQSTLESITIDMADRLEDIVFGQLKTVDPDQIAASPLRVANWRIYSQLLGIMSEEKFSSVTNRFLAELERYQKDEAVRGPSKEGDARAELLLSGLKHIRIRTTPDKWPKSCDFMRALGRLFVNAHGQRIKQTYCNTFERLLLPVATNPSCDLTLPKWKEFLELVHSRLPHMLTKPRHWPAAFPLHVLLLCLSTKENFSSQWLSLIQSLPAKLKDRPTRGPALQAMCRLVWTYFFRYSDSPTVTLRKVEEVGRIALPAGKRTYLSTDPAVAEPLTQLVRMIGFKHPDVCFRNIIFPLLNSDYFTSSGRDMRIEQMEPEKMVIGIQSFLAIVTDLENCDQLCPPVPTGSIPNPFTDPSASAHLSRSHYFTDPRLPGAPEISSQDSFSPVNVARLSDNVKAHYLRFCEILGNITILCDNTFGGQAALDEKFGGTTPKTPITEAFSFGRREDHLNASDQRQGFYDLLHVAIQALPRCLSDHIPFNSLINLLCTGTAHVQSNIAFSSAESLKAIARQSHAQQVTMGFARFIFNFDARYSTMSDEGMLGPGHIESTLRLYVELLRIWIEEIKQKTKGTIADSGEKNGSVSRALHLDLSSVLAQVEEVESHGLFFLCSQSRRVRSFAITVLRLITEFDKALGKENTRIIRILEADSQQILNVNDEHLTVAERSRIQKGKRRSASQNTLIELCSSEVSYDSTLWSKVFPNIVRISFETCPFAVTLGREIVCARLVQMHKAITALAESPQNPQYIPVDAAQARSLARSNMTAEILIEQWKLYLVMACTTLNSVGAQSQSQLANAQHARKTSRGSQSSDKIGSARSLFAFVIPLLSAERASIRDAIVIALGSINQNLYRTLLESLQYAVTTCNEEAKIRIGTHHRTPSSPRRSRKTDRLRTEVTHVYKLTSKFLKEPEVYSEDWIVNNLVTYAKDLRIFLSDAGVQNDWEFQSLRFHYCGLMEELFEGVNRTKDPSRWIPFEARKSSFSLMEDWCGYSPNQAQISQREEYMRKLAAAHRQEAGAELRGPAAAMEIEKKNLRAAALGAMASLCAGPISISTESGSVLQFDVGRMLSWIEIIFNTISDKWHAIGRRALKNLILHNKEHSYLLERSVEMCYVTERPKSLESYFEVVTEILIDYPDYPLGFWRILGAVLVTLGSAKREIRMKSAKLLRILEERQQKNSRLQDFDISISDKTTAVYKLAQFETSKRLAQQHADLAFTLFSQFSLHFKNLRPDSQRNLVAAILPWVQTIELQVDPNGGPTAKSYMLLANLFEITIKSSTELPNEVQALWQALATGPHGGNVQLVLDFVISLCLERKEQNFVEYAKQVVVFLSGTPAGSKVIEFFLMHVGPKNMVQERKEVTPAPPDINSLPYVADLATVLPVGNKQAGLSFGQIALIFLVDLMVAPVTLSLPDVVKLLHVVIILWDHYTLTVQEQAREMLVHLIHELIAAKIEDDEPVGSRQSIEDFVECIRRSDPKVVWEYEDNRGKDDSEDDSRVPAAMSSVTRAVVEFFSLAYEGITDLWAKEALNWATSCPVRHLACRSFQVFRSISTCLDSRMLADMLARLSNTIADEEADYRTFSMEILTTLKIIINSRAPSDLLRYPQLFWTTCACLNTIHETEFVESIGMLEKFMDRVDMSDPMVVGELIKGQPPKWEGGFDGIQNLVYKGLKSSQSLNRTLDILHRLSALPNNELIGDGNRLLFTILANLSHFLRQFDPNEDDPKTLARATLLARVAEGEGCPRLAASLLGFANGQYKAENDFLSHIITEVRSYFFPQQDVQSLTFLMGLLTNATDWFRVKIMKILCAVIPEVEMRRSDVASHGPDLISPLLRLLQTDLCPQALQVMDHIMTVSGSPMERHHIRMSMASSTSSRAIRKEYERVQSLYGIPEPTGWSIPMPAAQSGVTRNNVHAVFYTCAEVDRVEAQETVPSEVEFHADEYSDNFFPMRADTMQSIETQTDGNIGDIVQKLDSLDDFFEDTETSHPTLDALPDMALRGFAGSYMDANANIYDQQTAPILRKSLARTASTSSFHNGLVDSRPSNMRFDSVGIHSGGTSTPHSSIQTLRPVSHTRSVTSPVNHVFSPTSAAPQFSTPPIGSLDPTFLSDDETDEGAFDFDDRLMVNKYASGQPTAQNRSVTDGSSSLESMIRSGMRRLTGSTAASRDKERQRDFIRAQHRAIAQTANSPRVPKVPAEYLGAAASNPNSPG